MLANDFYDAKPSMHTKNVGASAISGAIVGGGLSAYFRAYLRLCSRCGNPRQASSSLPFPPLSLSRLGGPQKLLPGLTTFAVLCTSMQLLGNELRVLRVHMLTERDEAPDAVGSATQTLPSLREAHAASLPVDAPPQPVESAASTDSDWLGWIGSYLVSLSPVRKVSDGEYQEQLQTRRRHVLEKLREVENGIAREEAAAQKQV